MCDDGGNQRECITWIATRMAQNARVIRLNPPTPVPRFMKRCGWQTGRKRSADGHQQTDRLISA